MIHWLENAHLVSNCIKQPHLNKSQCATNIFTWSINVRILWNPDKFVHIKQCHPPTENLLTPEKFTKERQPNFRIYDIFWVKIYVQGCPGNLAFF